jgi:hypothetical protein
VARGDGHFLLHSLPRTVALPQRPPDRGIQASYRPRKHVGFSNGKIEELASNDVVDRCSLALSKPA